MSVPIGKHCLIVMHSINKYALTDVFQSEMQNIHPGGQDFYYVLKENSGFVSNIVNPGFELWQTR